MKEETFSNDSVMLQTQQYLMRDLQPSPLRPINVPMDPSAVDMRSLELGCYMNAGALTFKKLYQIDNFLKRYLFEKDLHSEKSLKIKAASDFLEAQEAFGRPKDLSRRAKLVEDRARTIVSDILGEYKLEDHLNLCKWGKKAAKGLPLSKSYLDNRVNVLTATRFQASWFRYAVLKDNILRDCVDLSKIQLVDHVDYSLVPKSYKAMRGIAPDTVVGGFLSSGLGLYLREKLEANTHINLSRAQEVHKDLARASSISGKNSTIDMSKASDSFVWDHVKNVVPRDWHRALLAVRTSALKIEGVVTPLNSFMLMGSGHTFPLQTILFYAYARAVVDLFQIKGSVHVFGDDVILPTRCATAFMAVLTELGFSINSEKSFWTGSFRESCGGDYYNGVDVRPAMPQGSYSNRGKRSHIAFVFKVVNSLLKKWDAESLPLTMAYLHTYLSGLMPAIPKGIPGVHGEESCVLYEMGLKLQQPVIFTRHWRPYVEQRILVPKTKKRKKRDERPYYWAALRMRHLDGNDDNWELDWDQETGPRHCPQAGERFPTSENQKQGGECLYQWKRAKRPLPWGAG